MKNIPSYEEFKGLDINQQIETLLQLKRQYKVKDILDVWGISRGTFYKLIHDLNIPLKKDFPDVPIPDSTTFTISLNGIYTGKQIAEKISKLINIIDETKKFYIKLEIKEL